MRLNPFMPWTAGIFVLFTHLTIAAADLTPVRDYFPDQSQDVPPIINAIIPTEMHHTNENNSSLPKLATLLKNWGEPSLYLARRNPKAHCYRFTWQRENLPAIVIRLEVSEDGKKGRLFARRQTQTGVSLLQEMPADYALSLDAATLTSILAQVESAQFWTLPSAPPEIAPQSRSSWVVEGVKNKKYHVVERQMPPDSAFRAMALGWLQAADLSVSDVF